MLQFGNSIWKDVTNIKYTAENISLKKFFQHSREINVLGSLYKKATGINETQVKK